MSRKILMVAFHFPPFAQSTGAQRIVSFIRELPAHGWQPIILTAKESVYGEIDRKSLELIAEGVEVVRASGWDVARHLSIRGRYPQWLALPDRWVGWALHAIGAGLRVIRREKPTVLWATFPVASALLAAIVLRKLSGLPLIVDLRDPIVYEHWPADPTQRRVYGWIERKAVRHAKALVVTTPGARKLYLEKYPDIPAERVHIIANGVADEAVPTNEVVASGHGSTITVLHSGLMEIPDRDPSAFFAALSAMRRRAEIAPNNFRVVLRATGRDREFSQQVEGLGLTDLVQVAPRLTHAAAMAEMDTADGLLLFQGEACNRQIPAKAYEYLARQRPIIGLCDPRGDTCDLLKREWDVRYIADMADSASIERTLGLFLADIRSGSVQVPSSELIATNSRRARSRELVKLLDSVDAARPA